MEEKAFIPDNISSEILLKEQEQLVYYNEQQEVLYAMKEGTLYKVDLEKGKKEALVENLEKDQYVSSKMEDFLPIRPFLRLKMRRKLKCLILSLEKSGRLLAVLENLFDRLDLFLRTSSMGLGARKMQELLLQESMSARCISWKSVIQTMKL